LDGWRAFSMSSGNAGSNEGWTIISLKTPREFATIIREISVAGWLAADATRSGPSCFGAQGGLRMAAFVSVAKVSELQRGRGKTVAHWVMANWKVASWFAPGTAGNTM
jgi:hypothetical protein